MKPVMAAAAASSEAREEDLVASAQAGNAEAFEILFRRYQDRITSFVRASIRDDGRSEDLVQEIFLAAHNSLPSLGHPAAFRSWLYQIARNACLDEVRRRSRQDELIFGWDEFPPPDERIVVHNQSADRVASRHEEFEHLTQALGELPESQHDALVMRELEGRSYDEIGRRMRLSRPAVESVLFRARRGLKGEYSEIETGERCRQMKVVMVKVAEGMGELRERRKLIRHMRDCAVCRREAAAMGLAGLAVPSDDRHGVERAFSRLAAFLPLPAFFGRRAQEADQLSSAGSFAAQAQGAAAQLSVASSDHVVSAVHKAAAVVAAVAVVGGGGVAIHKAGVGLPVKLPMLDKIAPKKHGGGEAAKAAAGTGGGKVPPGAAGARKPGEPAPGVPGGPAAPTNAAHAQPTTGTAAPLPATTAPAAGAPTSTGNSPAAPAGGSDPGTGAPTDTSGGAPATGGSGGSDTPSTTAGGGSGSGANAGGGTGVPQASGGGTTTTPPATGDTATDPLPPGIANQLLNGKRTLDDLPPGLKKKLGLAS